MSVSLYDATVRAYLQLLEGLSGVLERGLAHCQETGVDPQTIVETRLIADMHPFAFQIQSVAHHSRGAVAAVEAGAFSPPPPQSSPTYAELQATIAEATAALKAMTPEYVNGLAGRRLVITLGDRTLYFVAEDFLLTFSTPNFYFHAATAYDILRMTGAPIGKRNYLGRFRFSLEPPAD